MNHELCGEGEVDVVMLAVRVQMEETKEDGINKKIYYNKHKFLKKDYHQDHQFYQAQCVVKTHIHSLKHIT
jgi:hypothetical protein